MKYFIGSLIGGETATWHINCAKSISEKFNTWKLHEKIPPHVTIYYPFEAEDIERVKGFLNDWAKGRAIPGNLSLSGFGCFDDRVVFANITADQAVKDTVEELRTNLRQVTMTSSREDLQPWHPHATLANKLTPTEITEIWNYVQTLEKPNFTFPFDNATIFRFEGERKWSVEESYRF